MNPAAGEGGARRHARVRHRDVRERQAAARAAGKDLRTVYRETYDALKPRFGHWVIFDHCLPFDVTRAYDEATQLSGSAHLDRAARQGDVGGAGRLTGRRSRKGAARSRPMRRNSRARGGPSPSNRMTLRQSHVRVPARRRSSTAPARHCRGDRRRRGPGRPDRRDRPRAARRSRCSCSTRTTRSASARARSATRSARSRSSTAWAAASRSRARAWAGRSARSTRATSSRISSTSCRRPATTARRSSTCSSITSRSASSARAHAHAGARAALAAQGHGGRAATATASRSPSPRPTATTRSTCDWLVVCDGARSPIRHMLGLDFEGQVFRDRFLIADIRMTSDFPAERRFWFDPPFHPNQSVLLHRQADDIWRVDFQLGWDADPEREKQPERILPRLRAMLGPDAQFELEWASVYTFQCRRMQKFRHGRLLFAGDAAHLVSPFGARGANSGIQDADNLVWKLELVLRGEAPEALLDTYDTRARSRPPTRTSRNSTRSTDFITPKSAVSRTFRDAVLALARRHPVRAQARQQRTAVGAGGARAIAAQHARRATDVRRARWCRARWPPTRRCAARAATWLLDYLGGGFVLLAFGDVVPAAAARRCEDDPCLPGRARSAARRRERPRRDRRPRGPASRARYDGRDGHLLPVPPRPARVRALARVRSRGGARRDRARHRRSTEGQRPMADARSPTPTSRRPTTSTRS